MSMEQSIDKLADAILALAKAMGERPAVVQEGREEAPGKPAPTRTATGKSAKNETATESRSETPPAEEPPAATEEPAATQTVAVADAKPEDAKQYDYERDVKPLFIKLIQKRGRDAGKALIAEYNPDAAKLPEAITAEQYGEVIARINELLEG